MGSTYPIALILHSWLRWAVLIALVLVVVRSWLARRNGRWTPGDTSLHGALVGMTDLQLLVGLWLYFGASPFAQAFLRDIGAGMGNRELRFWGLEHVTVMLAAVACVHVGRARAKKAADDATRGRRAFAWTLAALLLVLSSIPWPFLPVVRPLFRVE